MRRYIRPVRALDEFRDQVSALVETAADYGCGLVVFPQHVIVQLLTFGTTLTFRLRQGFRVIGVVSRYLRHDPESLGYAAVIEGVNEVGAAREGYAPAPWPAPA